MIDDNQSRSRQEKACFLQKAAKTFRSIKSAKATVRTPIGRIKRRQNATFHAVCDAKGRPIIMLLSEGPMSDHKGARLMFDTLPPVKDLLGDQGYDSDQFRVASVGKGINPCIPPRQNRKIQHIDISATAILDQSMSPDRRTRKISLKE